MEDQVGLGDGEALRPLLGAGPGDTPPDADEEGRKEIERGASILKAGKVRGARRCALS